jgi:zinc protease
VNAQTGEDYTVLATVFPSKDLAKELEDAAARMGGLRVTDADVERERERIARELGNMFVGVPFLATFNHARERAVPSPGGARRAGVPEQMETITPEGVTARLEQYYKPGNALLILAGDINVDEAKRMISEHFGDLPAGEPVPAAAPRSLARVGAIEEISMSASYAASPPLACLAYAAPLPSDHLYAPFLVLTTRMWNRAMELGLDPGQFPVRFNPVDDPHVIAFQTQVGDGEGNDEAISRIRSFISSAILQGFQEEEIQTVRQTLAFFLGVGEVPIDVKRANPYGAAFGLGRRHQLGIDPPALVQQLEDLTSADVRRAGGTIFAPDKGAAVILRSSKKGVKSTD